MNYAPEHYKWMQLRAKTDRQLIALLHKTLAGGLRMALEAAEADAPELYAQAQKAFDETRRLLPLVRNVSIAERRPLERELARLGCLLDETAVEARTSAACS
jgi:hypothetical protein